MFIFKCKMCGGDVRAEMDATYGVCDHCGGTSTLPKTSDERIVNLFNRADHLSLTVTAKKRSPQMLLRNKLRTL
ncbi:MAG: hypothetical protein FWC20_10710 [Oscillospiraceae bacterium]|nr:hypothetical protein [Oscillospiraceae bacterium]MCL2279859.1 hypothetical protein [Oscillospiraceae bacterium]